MKLPVTLAGLLLMLALGGAASAKDVKVDIKISGMSCQSCANRVKSALARVKGIRDVNVSYEKGLATVVYDNEQIDEQRLLNAISETGFKAALNKEKK